MRQEGQDTMNLGELMQMLKEAKVLDDKCAKRAGDRGPGCGPTAPLLPRRTRTGRAPAPPLPHESA
eukprot:6239166-Prymnesium_polylepis.1